jgi:hypothetical protein
MNYNFGLNENLCGDIHFMSQTTDMLLSIPSNRWITSTHSLLRGIRRASSRLFRPTLSELLVQLEKVTTPAHLTKTVNTIQYQLWKLPEKEQMLTRKRMITILSNHTLHGTGAALRIEAAGWLRLLLQAGLVAKPEGIFVTLVTAAVRKQTPDFTATTLREQKTLLSLLFQCFWPFHFPYPAYRWELFPNNKVFYPLASLMDFSDDEMQHTLFGIFAELPSLDDAEFLEFVLPVALQWSKYTDPEHRRRAPNILVRVNQENALQAVDRLLADADPQVKESAKSAAGYTRRARA